MHKKSASHLHLSPENAEYRDVLLGAPIVLLPSVSFKAWVERLNHILATGANTVFYEMGHEHGKNLVMELKRKFKNPAGILSAGINHWFFLGMGKMKITPLQFQKIAETGNITVKIENNFHAVAIGKTGHAVCHLTRGYRVGGFEALTGKKWTCEETKCLSKNDEYCEFELRMVNTGF